jgi:hypothetical protein
LTGPERTGATTTSASSTTAKNHSYPPRQGVGYVARLRLRLS